MKKLISFVLAMVLLTLSLSACDEGNEPAAETTITDAATTTEAVTDPPKLGLTIMENKKGVFKIVRGDTCPQAQTDAAIKLNKAIMTLTGEMIHIETDYIKRGETLDANALEILVGDTNRPESAELKATINGNCFAIKTTDTKIVIVAKNDNLLALGMDYFIENYLAGENIEVSAGNLLLKTEIDYLSKPINPLFDVLKGSKVFASSCTKIYNIARPSDEIRTVQGGCSDGKYYYQAFLKKVTDTDEKTNVVRIVKVDLKTGKRIMTSGDLDLNHSNDITYNSKTNQLIVCHNNPYRTKISIIDPETLEFIESKIIPCSIFSIDYNAKRDMYVVGLSGGQSFRFLNADFEYADDIVHAPTSQTKGYITQGVACDDDLIYFVLWKENVITVYDWEGDFVSLIELDIGDIEPENISIVDSEIYVSAASGGAAVWKVVPTAKQ